jgi:hypothetical protein
MPSLEKQCRVCREVKPLTAFPKKSKKTTLTLQKTYEYTDCKQCKNNAAKLWRAKAKANKHIKKQGKISSATAEEKPWISAIRFRSSSAKRRSKDKNNLFNLTEEYLYDLLLKQNKCCALTGVPLSLEMHNPLCISLDQIEPNQGYTEGNIQWLAWCVNFAKGELTNSDFIRMCQLVVSRHT